eukprot:gene21348-28284_t
MGSRWLWGGGWKYLKNVEGCEIVGIEIVDGAKPIQSHPFKGPTAFMLGNEGDGMTQRQMDLCDSFVYIPQFGAGTASLNNVQDRKHRNSTFNETTITAVVQDAPSMLVGYSERDREGAKFVVADRPQRTRPRGIVAPSPDEVRMQRQKKRASSAGSAEGIPGFSHLFAEEAGPGADPDAEAGPGADSEAEAEAEVEAAVVAEAKAEVVEEAKDDLTKPSE